MFLKIKKWFFDHTRSSANKKESASSSSDISPNGSNLIDILSDIDQRTGSHLRESVDSLRDGKEAKPTWGLLVEE